MQAQQLESWLTTGGSGPPSRLQHRFLNSPHGYVIGVALWPAFLSVLSLWALLLQSGLSAPLSTVGGLFVGVGGGVVTSVGSAVVLGVTAWNTPAERTRRQFALLFPSLFVAVLLFGLYSTWPTIPLRDELGVSAFLAHELSKIVFLGPTIGFVFVSIPLAVLGYRIQSK